MNPTSIICPKCQNKISIDEALSHQVTESLKKDFELQREKEREEERKQMTEWRKALENAQAEKEKKLEQELKEKLAKESLNELKFLKEELEKQRQESQKAKENELVLRKKTIELEEREKNLELEKQRQIDEERKKIQEKTEQDLTEKFHLKEKEKDVMIESLQKSLEDAQRKINQGSQQLQGEVQELEMEKMLKAAFPFDEIEEIKKGVRGADTLQIVRDHTGRKCGIILWESKRTKDWENPWTAKLKEDVGKCKADIGIIVSNNLPKEVRSFGSYEGIYVSDFISFIALAQIMRTKIIDLCYAKLTGENKEDKKEILWQYLRSNEFKQRVEGIIDYFRDRRTQIDKQRRYFSTEWAKEEKLIEKVLGQTAGLYGDLQGLMGASLPQIPSLEITTTEASIQFDSTQVDIKETTVVADNFSRVDIEHLTDNS